MSRLLAQWSEHMAMGCVCFANGRSRRDWDAERVRGSMWSFGESQSELAQKASSAASGFFALSVGVFARGPCVDAGGPAA